MECGTEAIFSRPQLSLFLVFSRRLLRAQNREVGMSRESGRDGRAQWPHFLTRRSSRDAGGDWTLEQQQENMNRLDSHTQTSSRLLLWFFSPTGFCLGLFLWRKSLCSSSGFLLYVVLPSGQNVFRLTQRDVGRERLFELSAEVARVARERGAVFSWHTNPQNKRKPWRHPMT